MQDIKDLMDFPVSSNNLVTQASKKLLVLETVSCKEASDSVICESGLHVSF